MGFEVLDVVIDACRVQGLDPHRVDGYDHVVTAEVRRGERQWRLFAEAEADDLGVIVYSVWPERVAPASRDEVAALAVRVTYALRYGTLELDLGDGEVRIRTAALVGAGPVPLGVVAELIEHNLMIAETVFPFVATVAAGEAVAAEAFDALARALA